MRHDRSTRYHGITDIALQRLLPRQRDGRPAGERPLEDGVPLLERDVEGDLEDGVVEAVALVVRLEDVALGAGAGARVLRQVDVGEAQLAEVSAALLFLRTHDEKIAHDL